MSNSKSELKMAQARERLGPLVQDGHGDKVGSYGYLGGDYGVVIFESETLNVLCTEDSFYRESHNRIHYPLTSRHNSAKLRQISDDIRFFSRIRVNDVIRYEYNDCLNKGRVVEKRVYGALVAGENNIIYMIGFRRFWPVGDGRA